MTTISVKRARRRRTGFAVLAAGLGTLVLVGLMAMAGLGSQDATAKDKPDKEVLKTLKIVSVTNPAIFKGVNPYPVKAGPGYKLVAVTIDMARDFKNHLRSSEAGEIYLSSNQDRNIYHTVETALPRSEGAARKPAREATFVFMVPEQEAGLTFHYGTGYTLPFPLK